MFKTLFKNRAADQAGFTVLEIAIGVGIMLIATTVCLVCYGDIMRGQEAAVVRIAAETGYGVAASGLNSAEEVEEKISMDGQFTVRAYNVPVAGESVGLIEPCVVVEAFGITASEGDCDGI